MLTGRNVHGGRGSGSMQSVVLSRRSRFLFARHRSTRLPCRVLTVHPGGVHGAAALVGDTPRYVAQEVLPAEGDMGDLPHHAGMDVSGQAGVIFPKFAMLAKLN